MALNWEEEVLGLIRRVGGGTPAKTEFFLDRLAGDERDVTAGDAQVVKFTIGKAAQLVDGVTVAAPIAEIADQVHFVT